MLHPVLVGIGLALFYGVLLFANLQRFLDHDQAVYAMNVWSCNGYKGDYFINPHHLHFEAGGFWFHTFLNKFPEYFSDNIMFHLRLRSLLFGMIGVFAMYFYFWLVSRKIFISVCITLCAAFTHGYLDYSAKNDTGIYPAAWLYVMMIFGYFIKSTDHKYYLLSMATGFVFYLGVMAHEYMLFACVSIFFYLLIPSGMSFPGISSFSVRTEKEKYTPGFIRKTFSLFLIFLFCFIPTAQTYLWGGRIIFKLEFDNKYYSFQNWLFGYLLGSPYGKAAAKFNPELSFRGFTDALFARTDGINYNQKLDFLYNFMNAFDPVSFTHTAVISIILLSAAASFFFLPFLLKRFGREYILLIMNIIFFIFIGIDIEPYYFEFWIIPAMLAVQMAAFLFIWISEKAESFEIIKQFRYVLFFPFILFASLIIQHNYNYELKLHSRNFLSEAVYGNLPNHRIEYFRYKYLYKNPEEPYKEIDSNVKTLPSVEDMKVRSN